MKFISFFFLNIDAMIFVFPPRPIIWPDGSLGEVVQKQARTLIYSRDENLRKIFAE